MVQENDSMKALTPGNFLIARPIWRLYPDRSHIFTPHFILRCWQLEPKAFTSFSAVMATEISRWFKKCHDCTWNLTMSDVILLCEDNETVNSWYHWSVSRKRWYWTSNTRTMTAKTAVGMYSRPVTKIVFLLPNSSTAEINADFTVKTKVS